MIFSLLPSPPGECKTALGEEPIQTDDNQRCKVRDALKRSLYRREASLTHIEKTFLSALLIDRPSTEEEERQQKEKIANATKVLDDEILFSVPFVETRPEEEKIACVGRVCRRECHDDDGEKQKKAPPRPPKPTRSNKSQRDLWKAHQDGVAPRHLRAKSSLSQKGLLLALSDDLQPSSEIEKSVSKTSEFSSRGIMKSFTIDLHVHGENKNQKGHRRGKERGQLEKNDSEFINNSCVKDEDEDDVGSLDVQSDREVGRVNDDSTASSWNSSQGGFDHYNAWEVIRDEYAEDFGFNVAVDDENQPLSFYTNTDEEGDEVDSQRGMFKILGTSAEDKSATPHVLSPPLMDSLLNFVPDRLSNDNFWLKFSLIRDGASLDTLKRYCRAATYTVLAIETTQGEVFGSFTSAPWQLNNRYFGTGESFLWKMRHNRNTKVHSLFEQAQLESEIDVFPFNGQNEYIQLCTSDKIALGGGAVKEADKDGDESFSAQADDTFETPVTCLRWDEYGFGLALDENLLRGTTSPCATFRNPGLVNYSNSGELFDVMNLEVWTLTSAATEREAERTEMSLFFVRESPTCVSGISGSKTSKNKFFAAEDLKHDTFYRRVGQYDENETDRNAWQYAQMMNPGSGSPFRAMRKTL